MDVGPTQPGNGGVGMAGYPEHTGAATSGYMDVQPSAPVDDGEEV